MMKSIKDIVLKTMEEKFSTFGNDHHTEETELSDLSVDSLDAIDILMAAEQELQADWPQDEWDEMAAVFEQKGAKIKDVIDAIERHKPKAP